MSCDSYFEHLNLNLLKQFAEQLEESIADCIIMIEVLHEIRPEIRVKALDACRRALKPGGIFFIEAYFTIPRI
jgi:SAM-dependent methyltransferase